MTRTLMIAALVAGLAGIAVAQTATTVQQTQPSSGTATGAATGAVGGAIVGGPVGAVVGGVAGAIVGGIADSMQPKFRTYVVEQKHPDYVWGGGTVAVGTVLPESGVTYYQIPAEYQVAPQYRYARVNGQYVLVDPATRKIVQVLQ